MGHFEGDKSLSQASAKAKIKWFNGTKGYGFVTLDNGGDAFCHASVLAAAGHQDLPPGSSLVCDLADSQRGMQVVAIHSVDVSTSEAQAPRGPRRDFDGGGDRFGGGDRYGSNDRFSGGYNGGSQHGGQRGSHHDGQAGPMTEGKVKFFNDQKGFGFVMPDSGNGDIYLHASALRRSGIQAVEPEQRIRFSTRQGNKGVEVDKVELI
jgi:CspA family cold shock protein